MNPFRDLYLNNKLFQALGIVLLLLLLGYTFRIAFIIGQISLYVVIGILAMDIAAIFRSKKPVHCVRFVPVKLSNGDPNEIRIYLENRYPFRIRLKVIDELPYQFQKRDTVFILEINPGKNKILTYSLRPVKRGEYHFGAVNVYVSSPLGFISRRFRFMEDVIVPVYPSFLQINKYEIMAISKRLSELGLKKMRKLGHHLEFEQIKEYVQGDDHRTINWKATARKGDLMVNTYQDERSQQVYCLIDKGRTMRLPFEGMTLLDYAINASLVLSNIAIKKDDKAGIITFHQKISNILPASKRKHQMSMILKTLYNQKTAFKESDFSRLFTTIKSKINHRSLLLLFTNFETLSGMKRQLNYLRKLATSHVLVVIFFENTTLQEMIETPAKNLRSVYHKTIAEKYMYEKKMIAKTLNNYGIYTILTTPQNLNVATINKYLEFKSRGVI
ncbi:MAG: DUF58 domain-containing protein [Bacteroidetes bacterium]|nr:DUF58 domain-containing protein [Bacteroidota bacterium]